MAWPTTNDPKTEFITLRLTESERAELDAVASAAGMKPGPYLRDCYRRVQAAERRRAARLKGKQVAAETAEEEEPT